jgi:hypothetical protein
VFNMADFVCPHHREFASRFFDSSSDSEWDSDDSYYDYDTDEYDSDSGSAPVTAPTTTGNGNSAPVTPGQGDFFYSFHSHPPQNQAKPKGPGS